MNYKNCFTIGRILFLIGLPMLVVAAVLDSVIIRNIGIYFLVATPIFRILFFRCPYCNHSLPLQARAKNRKIPYRCVYCGNEIEL